MNTDQTTGQAPDPVSSDRQQDVSGAPPVNGESKPEVAKSDLFKRGLEEGKRRGQRDAIASLRERMNIEDDIQDLSELLDRLTPSQSHAEQEEKSAKDNADIVARDKRISALERQSQKATTEAQNARTELEAYIAEGEVLKALSGHNLFNSEKAMRLFLLDHKVKFDRATKRVTVLGADNHEALDPETALPLTLKQAVDRFLAENDYLVVANIAKQKGMQSLTGSDSILTRLKTATNEEKLELARGFFNGSQKIE